MNFILGVDPGMKKCGIVLVELEKETVLLGEVVSAEKTQKLIYNLYERFPFSQIILGNGTTSTYWQKSLCDLVPINVVNEKGTTLLARNRYWELWPPSWWQRLVPKGLLVPSEELDAIAALVMVEKYLERSFDWTEKPDFKNVL